jgi:hypothetical protein
MTSLIRTGVGTTAARVDYGRWIADCRWCNGASLMRVGTRTFDCPCGALWEVVWPSEDILRGITRLLMMRPVENRWWAPGDSLTTLMWENGQHGIFDNLPSIAPGETLLAVTDDRVVSDRLPAIASQAMKAVSA